MKSDALFYELFQTAPQIFFELMLDDRIEMLTKLIRRKFRFAESTMEKLTIRLRRLPLEDLEYLFEDILEMKTLKQINAWIDERAPEPDQS